MGWAAVCGTTPGKQAQEQLGGWNARLWLTASLHHFDKERKAWLRQLLNKKNKQIQVSPPPLSFFLFFFLDASSKSDCSVCRNWLQLGGHVTLLESKTNNYYQINGFRNGRCSSEEQNGPTWSQSMPVAISINYTVILPVILKYFETNRSPIQSSRIKRQTDPPWKPR